MTGFKKYIFMYFQVIKGFFSVFAMITYCQNMNSLSYSFITKYKNKSKLKKLNFITLALNMIHLS